MPYLTKTGYQPKWRAAAIAVVLALIVAALAACGSSAAPEATSVPPATTQGESAPTSTDPAAPPAKLAPPFELPSATGETVSLASFAGDKNVVLVFYRGFW